MMPRSHLIIRQSDEPTMNPKRLKLSADEETNRIFVLNNDCLAEIFDYLPIVDLFNIYQTDKRFIEAVRMRFARCGIDRIDFCFSASVPESIFKEFTEIYGKTCPTMLFKSLHEAFFLPILTRFQSLRELTLSEIQIRKTAYHSPAFPTNLLSLEIDRCSIASEVLQRWIPGLNNTLRTLRLVHRSKDDQAEQNYSAFTSLHNLSSVVLDGMLVGFPNQMAALLANNKDHLKSVTMIDHGQDSYTMQEPVWQSLTKLEHLEHLRFNYNEISGLIPSTGTRLFPQLVTLQVDLRSRHLIILIEALACDETLNSLAVEDFSDSRNNIQVHHLRRFKNLRSLELQQGDWTSDDASKWKDLNQLRSLDLSSGVFNHPREIFKILQYTPFLHKLLLCNTGFFSQCVDVEKIEARFAKMCEKHQQPFEGEFFICEP